MSANNYTTPDLASILRTLAASTQSGQELSQCQPQTSHFSNNLAPPQPPVDGPHDPELELSLSEGEYDPNDALLPISASISHPAPPSVPTPSPAPSAARSTPSIPSIDPRTITTYPAALRYITRTLARNEATIARIRKLIASQHQHERQWWHGREVLVKQQGEREEGRRRVDEVLIDGTANLSAANFQLQLLVLPRKDDAAELARYDKKVYRACLEMVNATRSELQTLGIPFFGLRQEFVLPDGENDDASGDGPVKGDPCKRLREREVLALQKKVVELLEDLCQIDGD